MSTLETKEIESTDANPYEDLTCAECGYGGVDNTGLCVMDADHVAVIWTPILPQSDGIYFWRTRVQQNWWNGFTGCSTLKPHALESRTNTCKGKAASIWGQLPPIALSDLCWANATRRG